MAMPRISRRPLPLTATATITATEAVTVLAGLHVGRMQPETGPSPSNDRLGKAAVL
jgi:hypothetical protein